MHLRKADYFVAPVSPSIARELVTEHHYARGASNTATFLHGLYARNCPDVCLGVAWWLPPTKVAAESVEPVEWRAVLALSRLVVHPDLPTNAASFLMAASIRFIRRDGRFCTLLTYADEGQGHSGAIYRATNWEYLGAMKGHRLFVDPATGRQVAQKATVHRTVPEMLALGYEPQPAARKHKFVMRLDGAAHRVVASS